MVTEIVDRPYYTILGVPRSATTEQIRAAYRRLAKTMHPDAGGDPEAFIELSNAYTVLSDSELRGNYDLVGDAGDFNPLKFQKEVMESCSIAFKQTLMSFMHEGRSIDTVDFMKLMKNIMRNAYGALQHNDGEAREVLKSLHKLRDRIKRNDSEPNMFVSIIDKQILEKSAELKEYISQMRIAKRTLEEVENYKDANELLRTMQAFVYPARGSSFGNYLFDTITTT